MDLFARRSGHVARTLPALAALCGLLVPGLAAGTSPYCERSEIRDECISPLAYAWAGRGDLDGDGRDDLVFLRYASVEGEVLDTGYSPSPYHPGVELGYLPGTGSGFAPAVSLRDAPDWLYEPAHLADVDGDGVLDVWSFQGPMAYVFRHADGGFEERVLGPFHADGTDFAYAAQDVDGDGLSDVVHADASGLGVHFDAEGAPEEEIVLEGVTWLAAAGDLDGDGDSDAVAMDRTTTFVLWQVAPRVFERGPVVRDGARGPVRPVDLDGDGDLDLVAPDGDLVHEADGTWSQRAVGSAERWSVDVVDLDRDGDLDVVRWGWQGVDVYTASGGVVPTEPTARWLEDVWMAAWLPYGEEGIAALTDGRLEIDGPGGRDTVETLPEECHEYVHCLEWSSGLCSVLTLAVPMSMFPFLVWCLPRRRREGAA